MKPHPTSKVGGLKQSWGRIPSALLSLCLLPPIAAWAAPAPTPAIEPGRVQHALQPLPQPTSKPPAPAAAPAITKPSAAEEQVRFQLQGIELKGNQTIPTADFEDLWRERLGQETSLGRIKEIARQITARYRNAGYVLSQAVVPAQEVKSGRVTIQVVEGFVSQIQPETGKTLDGAIGRYAAHIPEGRPLEASELERWLLLMNDLPGVGVQSVLRPSPQVQGGADMTLKTERPPFEAMFNLNNRAGPYNQDWAGDLSATAYNLLGLDEGLFVRSVIAGDGATGASGGYRTFSLGLNLPLGNRGLKLDTTIDHTTSVPGADLEGLGYRGGSESARIRLEYPFQRSRSRSLYGHVGLDLSSSTLDLTRATPISDDQLRVLRTGLRLDWAGTNGVTLAQADLDFGLGIFGASHAGDPNLSRANGDGEFVKFSLDLVHIHPLPWKDGQVRADITAQISDRKLLSGEEFGLGGGRIGRAYDSSEITGDRGAGLGIEISQGLPRDFKAYGFYDVGVVADRDGGRQALASAGAGLRWTLKPRLNGQIEFAAPLTRPVASAGLGNGDDWRAFVSLTARY